MKKIPFILCFFLLANLLFGQDETSSSATPKGKTQKSVLIERYSQSHLFGAVYHILNDKRNHKWIACDKGVFKISQFESAPDHINADGKATALAISRKGEVWAGFSNGYLRNMSNGDYIKIKSDRVNINDLKIFKSKLWVASDQGLLVYNLKTKKLNKEYNKENSKLKTNKINFVYVDVYDQVWIGTEKGVSKFKGDKLKKPYDSGQQFKAITAKNDERWMITDKQMFIVYEEDRWNDIELKEDIHTGKVNDIILDNEGFLYVASDKLVRIDPYNDVIESYTEDTGQLSSKCLSLASDAYNHVYIGTGDSGLFRLRFSDTEFDQLSVTGILENPISCAGDNSAKLKIIASGGEKPYKYKWSDRSIKGPNPSGLAPGSYSVSVTDKNKIEFIFDITFDEPTPLQIQLVESTRITRSGKKDGALEIVTAGGSGDITYKWDNGKTGNKITKLGAGSYQVTVSDQNGCTAVQSFEVGKEKFIPELDIATVSVGQTLRINELFFTADSSIVNTKSYDVLDEIFEFLDSNKKVVIEIGGHTNNIPSHEYCDRLSSSRAKNVASYLYNKGISEQRIAYKGYGKREPVASNESLAGRKKNQRVEIKILSIL